MKKAFYMYPAAVKFHHAYIGGLAYHTTTMLEIADRFSSVYTYLNKDYLYSGIILHDVCKINELSGFEGGEYTVEGQLIGHLVMGALEVENAAKILNLADKEENNVVKTYINITSRFTKFWCSEKACNA